MACYRYMIDLFFVFFSTYAVFKRLPIKMQWIIYYDNIIYPFKQTQRDYIVL